MIGAVAPLFAVLHLLPQPSEVRLSSSCNVPVPRTVASTFDAGARDEIDERWSHLHVGTLQIGSQPTIVVRHDAALPPQAYRLRVGADGKAIIGASGADGAFYGAMTLAQLPRLERGRWLVPCLSISDRPALRWRILSDDVSRGPLPTMRYFEERLRTIAAFKMNGYSPYMEHVFVSPSDPLPAPLDGITPAQLRSLARYARRYHVTLIPEQQTFAHMHNTLKYEEYAPAAEFPHAFLLSPGSPLSIPYVTRLIHQELRAVGSTPFFHVGSDETSTLGEGTTQAYVSQNGGRSRVYAAHITEMERVLGPSGARLMLWDDGLERDPAIMTMISLRDVVVNWHYGAERTFRPSIDLIARHGFDQMVSPGANNWNEIYPDIDTALQNERRFIDDGKAARVLGLFETVWHDDGETLYESTWYPVLYAAAAAWEARDVDPGRFRSDFPAAFFGTADARFGQDVSLLAGILTRLEAAVPDSTDRLFWSDPFDDSAGGGLTDGLLSGVRLDAERVETHLLQTRPPLHPAAAAAMFLAARRYDALGRFYQAAREIRAYYADAQSHATESPTPSFRDLIWCTYWLWEIRDDVEELATLYERAWRYENREGHLASNLERYHLAAQTAIRRADAMESAAYAYAKTKALPPFSGVIP